MRITLESIFGGNLQTSIDPTEDKKFFVELILPAHRGDLLGEGEDPFPRFHSTSTPCPPKAAKLKTEIGWVCTYDCTKVIASEYTICFPTYNLWSIILCLSG